MSNRALKWKSIYKSFIYTNTNLNKKEIKKLIRLSDSVNWNIIVDLVILYINNNDKIPSINELFNRNKKYIKHVCLKYNNYRFYKKLKNAVRTYKNIVTNNTNIIQLLNIFYDIILNNK